MKYFLISIAVVSVLIAALVIACSPSSANGNPPDVLYQTTLTNNGQTLKEVLLPDGTRCVIVSYSTALQTVCDWSK